ncbi:sodium- and chloride-dependent GABA transporter 2-like [Mastacembelus armatus]|uniref:Transporter n=1 Tax=Mastacembelus armatus TaxID=205130 RepID=A0A3Q3NAU8_9TELE|nr:sodium- and chloride-dependent GABA transporter 2-like [Mastacembelus armatus]XP_026157492.1 sodium- and chloride-dependent GABA transporter 2-like [Mastacembelus armatus]XP_026157493.1 sodium- and chloride-dependent GABA transporter 2-like [Mastacembelus armatus]XP_026157494.1 sodium- and chloride-dependent GABA transporter 2-like [Mastacembelus armatus]XP_026157496.1 sodium- and chloride-dependent GABA transporter 2-like [Mastacembelus armatus]XP_026157497.1 sodium- and chloride-dependent
MADQLPPQQGDPLLDKCHQGSLPSRKEAAKNSLQTRGQWGSKAEFLLAVAGQIIGLGNVWRFPYLCYKNGGGVFFVPYLLFLVLCGIPLFLLETSLGQYTSLGGVSAWRTICPLFGGLGYASQVIILHGCVYYIIILAWALFYLSYSFQAELPWSHCNNTWNTETCVQFEHHNQTTHVSSLPENATSPVMEFWEREALRLSSSLDELGPISWKLALCLAIVWLTCYFCVWKGVKSTGKVVYLTATFPYVMLFVLLVRGVTLPGAAQGIIYYLKPNHTRLADPQVWMDAGTQIFFSYGICLGSLTALGSYNKYNNDCYKDSFFLCLLNSSTSFLAGFAIFSVLGFMAEEQGVDISTVAQSGPGLAFIAYPRAVAMMPLPQLWAVCFFLMIIMLGLDTQFVSLEALMTSITDLYPHLIRRGHRRELLLLFICIVCFLIGLVMVTPAGLYVFQIYDHFSCSGASLLLLSIFQSVAIGWVYGAERFSANIRDMTGYSPMPAFKLCWKYLTPAVCTATFVFSLVCWSPLSLGKGLVAPVWATMLGWLLTLSSVSLLPIWAIYALVTTPGTLPQRFQHLCSPAKASSTKHPALPYSPALPLSKKSKEPVASSRTM